MSVPHTIAELFNNNEENEFDSRQKIIEELLNDSNLDRKTELEKPIRWAILSVIEKVLDNKDLPKSGKILREFIDYSFKYLISHNRKGRKEYVIALQAICNKPTEIEMDESKMEKMDKLMR